MATIKFENIAPDDDAAKIPDGYKGLIWLNFWAIDDDAAQPSSGYNNVIESGSAAGYNTDFSKPGIFRSDARNNDFDLNSGYFAAAFNDDLEVTVAGYDNGEQVAQKLLILDTDQQFVRFGRKFDDIDKVAISASGGTDADPNDGSGPYFAVDDISISF